MSDQRRPKFCTHCGEPLPPGEPRFCVECGAPTTWHDPAQAAPAITSPLPTGSIN